MKRQVPLVFVVGATPIHETSRCRSLREEFTLLLVKFFLVLVVVATVPVVDVLAMRERIRCRSFDADL